MKTLSNFVILTVILYIFLDKDVFYFIFTIVFIIYIIKFFLSYLFKTTKNKKLSAKIHRVVELHLMELLKQRDILVTKDRYGNLSNEKWIKEVGYFCDNVVTKEIEDVKIIYQKSNKHKKDIRDSLVSEIIDIVEEKYRNRPTPPDREEFNDNMSGIEYENFCLSILKANNWDIETTNVTGDQGVDLIAKKNFLIVAIQCKRYKSNVGNKAVQEIYAGKNYINADYGVVISNSNYTKSAIELAQKNNILLIHHNDIYRLEELLKIF